MSDSSGLIIDKSGTGYTFKQTSDGKTLIYIRRVSDNSWNSPAYNKYVKKGSKGQDLDLNEIWYNKTKSQTDVKKINLENNFKSDPLKSFEVFYPSQINSEELLILGFVTQSGIKKYYSRTQLKLSEKNELTFSSLKPINESQVLEELYKENYSKNNTLTIKIDKIEGYHNVELNNHGNVDDSSNFKKYIHTPSTKANNFKNLVLDCGSKCKFNGFKISDYTNNNLKDVNVYFLKSDNNNCVPLLIEIKRKNNTQFGRIERGNGSSLYYKLTSIDKNKSDDDPGKWIKIYNHTNSVEDLSNKLNQIYTKLKENIDKIISFGDSNSTLVGAVSGSVTTIGAIGTGVGGFFLYKNSQLVITFLKSLF